MKQNMQKENETVRAVVGGAPRVQKITSHDPPNSPERVPSASVGARAARRRDTSSTRAVTRERDGDRWVTSVRTRACIARERRECASGERARGRDGVGLVAVG